MGPEQNFDPYDELQNIDFENKSLKNQNLELSKALSMAGQDDPEDQNLIHYQLETDKILERIEHFLKGDKIKFEKGNSYFAEPTKKILAIAKHDPQSKITYYIQELDKKDPERKGEFENQVVVKIVSKKGEISISKKDSQYVLKKIASLNLEPQGYRYVEIVDEDKKPLNEYGVAELMRIMSMYITKETFLSYYSEERINEILSDLGDALNNFLYCNYEKMGMDTKFKESKYVMICLNLLHAVESCYRRAIEGQEQEYLRSKSIITQANSPGGNVSRPQPKPKWNPFRPSTWCIVTLIGLLIKFSP